MAEKTVAVRLSDEQKNRLDELAQKRKATVSDIIRSFLEKETPLSPQEELEELRSEAERIQEQMAEIERTEEQKRIAEEERQRQEALSQLEAQIRQTLPELLDLRYRTLPELVNNGYETLAELASQYDDLIEKVEAKDVESAALKEKYLMLNGDFEMLYAEIEGSVEKVELSESAKNLLETIRKQRASWLQRSDVVLRFLDTRLVTADLEV